MTEFCFLYARARVTNQIYPAMCHDWNEAAVIGVSIPGKRKYINEAT